MHNLSSKILFVAYYYPPAGGAALPGSQRTVKFIRNIRKCQCHILSLQKGAYREYIDLNFNEALPVNSELITRTPDCDIFKLLLSIRGFFRRVKDDKLTIQDQQAKAPPTPDSIATKRSLFQKIKDLVYDLLYFPDDAAAWLIPAVLNGWKVVRREKIDVIFATGMPWTSLIVGYFLHKLTGKPFIVDFRDPWVGNPFHVSKGIFFDRLIQFLEKRIVLSASYVSANTPQLRDDFLLRYPQLDDDKVVVLPNGFDPFDFEKALRQPALPGALRLAHAGSLYGRRDPGPLLDALTILAVRHGFTGDNCRFLQMGYVEDTHDFDKHHADLTSADMLDDVGLLPYEECLALLAESDVAVLIQPATKIQIPSKLYDYLAMKKHILAITPLDGALAELMLDKELGDVFDPADSEGIANRLMELCEQKVANSCVKVAYDDVSEFDVRNITQKLELMMRTAVQRS